VNAGGVLLEGGDLGANSGEIGSRAVRMREALDAEDAGDGGT
jgi:hypothetical protein